MQLDLFAGKRRQREGIAKVASNNSTFKDLLRAKAIQLSLERGSVSIDELRVYCEENGIRPAHHNAYGSIFRGKEWELVGRKPSEFPSNHGREIRIWRYVSRTTGVA